MELAKQKLKKINDAWNHYFLEYTFCQQKINYTEEVSTNYYADVNAYFEDTFPLISKEPFSDGRKKHLGNAMALLQGIYVQQDLMDELMTIFGLPRSGSKHKKGNRELRNRLIGHPISRDKNTGKLVSTVFLRYDNPANEIIYILYEAPKYLNGKWQNEPIEEIVLEHDKYLNWNCDIILKKIKTILYEQRKQLKLLFKKAQLSIFDPTIIDDTFAYFEAIADDDYIFKQERLKEYYNRQNEHPRYKYSINYFRETLNSYLTERIADIETYSKEVAIPSAYYPSSSKSIKIKIVTNKDFKVKKRKYKKDLSYEFSKLLQKDHMIGVDYFMETFGHIPDALEELNNMKKNKHNDTEYYASYHYLKQILKGEHSRMFYE